MRVSAAATALAIGTLAVAAGLASAATITIGKGLPAWRLGQRYALRAGLVRSERLSNPYGPGCVPNVSAGRRIDYYLGLRVAWYPDAQGKLRLIDVATERAGDRSGDGFVVASSKRSAVRRRHPGASFTYAKGTFALGATSLTVFRSTGKETFTELVYWFDARGVLTALEAFAGGC